MIALIVVSFALGLLLMAITYRHAILVLPKKRNRVFVLSSLVFAFCGGIMGWVGLLFADSVVLSLPFEPIYASVFLLWLLGLKAWFNTRRSKLGQAMFDIDSPKVLLLLSFTFGFECFLAMTAIGFLGIDILLATAISTAELLLLAILGFYAGSRPNAIQSIRLFVSLAAILYIIGSLIALIIIYTSGTTS